MYCPECRLEFRDDIATCSECGARLTEAAPTDPPEPKAEWLELETVLQTSDAALLAVARSLLDAEGIPSFARGDLLQEFLGWGRLPSGTNLITGPVELQVPADRSAEARDLLAVHVVTSEAPLDESPET